jgi:glycine cleavage system T protein (aminomethyltransferase)
MACEGHRPFFISFSGIRTDIMGFKTPLYDTHVKLGAKIVDFGGWDMPLHYGSQIEEHHAVRRDCGLFDVSHMNVIDVKGAGTRDFLSQLVANDVGKLTAKGKALYSCMLNAKGGVIDDLIIYYVEDQCYRIVANAGTRDKDMAWIQSVAGRFKDVKVTMRDDLAMIAVQGPKAKEIAYRALGEALREGAGTLKPFYAATVDDLFVATTGYTGEDGFEIILSAQIVPSIWQKLVDAGAKPAGLGARDTLRLEAGMNLYGQDMDENIGPLESGLAWTVALEPTDRGFIGRDVLEKQKANGIGHKLVGLVLEGKGVLRNHQKVFCGAGEGEITSGSFSPTLERSIALARVPTAVELGSSCEVDIRGRREPARVVRYPFVRNGKGMI